MTAKPSPSAFSEIPGPLLAVTPIFPPKAAPMTAAIAQISSSAWKVFTPNSHRIANSCKMSLAGVMG